ncbi:MAG: Gfo/Idh/MocA family oxidoreductase [Armatimonadetes bacterium]|nr:Gfo/Idh/MocA family oxidoreductase [Armatimonadota bacterium]
MSHKVRIGVIGCGSFARYHFRQFQSVKEAEITALCDIVGSQFDVAREAFPELRGVPTYDDTGQMLAAGGFDAVLVSTPHTLHRDQAVACLDAGYHVLVDKPLATTAADCRDLIAARDRNGKVAAVSYQRHGLATFRYLREEIASGRHGRILGLNSHLTQQWLQFTGGTWRQAPALSGGGMIGDSGSHMVDVLLWATGLKASRVSSMMDFRGTPVDIDSVTSIAFEGGAYGTLTVIGDACLWHERHHVWLERSAFVLEEQDLLIIDEQGRHVRVSHWPADLSPEQNFVDAVLRGVEVLAPFEYGLRTIELTEAAWKSAAQGGTPVSVASL